jgi:YD repeat-containing protein
MKFFVVAALIFGAQTLYAGVEAAPGCLQNLSNSCVAGNTGNPNSWTCQVEGNYTQRISPSQRAIGVYCECYHSSGGHYQSSVSGSSCIFNDDQNAPNPPPPPGPPPPGCPSGCCGGGGGGGGPGDGPNGGPGAGPNGGPDGVLKGSQVHTNTLVLGETVSVVGAPFELVYKSDRTRGWVKNFRIDIPITSNPRNTNVSQVTTTVTVAGQTLSQTYSSLTDGQSSTFTWNGKDAVSNDVFGPAAGTIRLESVYVNSAVDTPVETNVVFGTWVPKSLGLGGWAPSIVHYYSPVNQTIYLGSGGARKAAVAAVSGNYSVPSSDGSEVYVFDSNGRHLTTRLGLTGATKFLFAYDASGRMTSITDAYGKVTVFNRSSGVLTSITAPYSQVTTVTLNSDGFLSSLTNPNSETYSMTYYSAEGLLNTFTKPRGQVSTFVYDSNGLLTSDTSSSGESWALTYFEYSNGAKSVAATTAVGRTSYSSSSVKTESDSNSMSYADGRTVSYSRDQYSATSVENGITQSGNMTGDPRFGSLAPYGGNGYSLLNGNYNPKYWSRSRSATLATPGDPFSITAMSETYTQNSKNWLTNYSPATKTFTTTSPLGRISTREINAKEDIVSSQVNGLTATSYSYNADGQVTQVARGSRTTSFAYGSDGRLGSTTNPLSQTTSFSYDSAGRVISQTLPDSRVVAFTYDANSNLTGVTPPGKPFHAMSFNLKDLISAYTPPAVTGAGQTTYVYNNDKQLTQINRPGGQTITYNYLYYAINPTGIAAESPRPSLLTLSRRPLLTTGT